MAEVSRLELLSLNEYQKSLYHDKEVKGETTTPFYTSYSKPFFNVQTRVKMQGTTEGSVIVYTLPHEHHFLVYTYMVTKFPSIRVHPDYRGRVEICWPHNLGTSHIINGCFSHDTLDIQLIDNLWYDTSGQYLIKPSIRELYDNAIGNIPALEDWSGHLPAYTCAVPQPFYYTKFPGLAFPIGLCDPKSKITHRFNLRLKIGDLLRMRCRQGKDSPWSEVTPINFNYLEGVTNKSALDTPELWARCASVTKDELSWNQERNIITHYIENVISVDSPNPVKSGTAVNLPIETQSACRAIFWVAENVNATKLHNYSNYTTDISSCYRGHDPIKSISLKYGTHAKIDSLESHHNSIIEPMFHAKSAPNMFGFHMSCIGHNIDTTEIDSTLALGALKSMMIINISTPDPFLIVDSKSTDDLDYLKKDNKTPERSLTLMSKTGSTECEYLPKIRLLITRRLIFTLKDGNKNGYFELHMD
ncbi:MAG: divergent major capsid protein [Solumvirus sp.]|uniref:Divergent major capsid protein n=1 Tax=Solumvirus sp. TaxID=2487773 RepID=A0A3G5AGF2_9VIRU|nr:MAG: divergent major capsid protein [Solumvirus sp.]